MSESRPSDRRHRQHLSAPVTIDAGAGYHGCPMTNCSDDQLLRLAGRGDASAFERLIERHGTRAFAIASRMSATASDAEDIVQEAFLRAWLKAPDWKVADDSPGRARFSTWFYRVLVNLCIDRHRRADPAALDDAAAFTDDRPSAFDRVADDEAAREIAAAISRLPSRQRAALTLCYYESMSNREAAAILNASVKALESLLVRARRRLKEDLASRLRPALEENGE